MIKDTNYSTDQSTGTNCTALLAKPTVSRRTFLSLTAVVGTLTFLGISADGHVAAYADEAGNTHFVITILSKEEIAVYALDGANEMAPLEGVQVVVTSRYNGEEVTGSTEADGSCILNVRQLSQEKDDPKAQSYTFFAAAELTKTGYRENAFTRQYIESGPQADGTAHITLVTQPFDVKKDVAYLRMACFDGNDLLYHKADIYKYSGNTMNHEVLFQVACTPGKTVDISFVGNDKVIETKSAVADSKGFATVTMTGPYIANQAIGTVFKCGFKIDGVTRATTLTLNIQKPPIDYPGAYYDSKWMFSMGTGAGVTEGASKEKETADFFIPDYRARYGKLPKTPWGGNQDLSLDLPWLPINLIVDPRGAVGVSFSTAWFNIFSNINGENIGPDPETWFGSMLHPFNTYGTTFEMKCKGFAETYKKAGQNAGSTFGVGAAFFGSFSIAANYEIAGLCFFFDPTHTLKEKYVSGTIMQTLNGIIAGEFGALVYLFSIPAFVSFDFMVYLSFQAESNLKAFPALQDPKFSTPTIGPHGEGGFFITIFIDFGASVGVGIKGLLSASIRGYFSLPMLFIFQEIPDKPYPHKCIYLTGGVMLVTQFLFFTHRMDLMESWQETILDNWESDKPKDSLESGSSYDDFYRDPAFGEPGEKYTNDAILGTTAEITAVLNDQGFLCSYEMNDVARPDVDQMTAACQGMRNPYEANGAYNPRKGLIPNIEIPFTAGGAVSNDASDMAAFSDSRAQIVQLGNVLYFCRIATVEVTIPNNLDNLIAMVDAVDDKDIFIIRNNDTGIPHLQYNESEIEGQIGSLTLSGEYKQASLYADENGGSMAVAEVDIPVFSFYEGDEPIDMGSVDDWMQDMATALGWDTKWEDEQDGASPVNTNAASVFRTRVVVTAFDLSSRTWAGKPDVIDFVVPSQSMTCMRCDMNDVDFTPVADEASGSILFGLVSCTKPMKRRRTVEEMKEGLFTTVLRYTPNAGGHGTISDVHSNVSDFAMEGDYEWKAIPFLINRVVNGVKSPFIGLTTTGVVTNNVIVNHFYPLNKPSEQQSLEELQQAPNKQILYPDSSHRINDNGVLQIFIQPNEDPSQSDAILICWQHLADSLEGSQTVGPTQVKGGDQKATVWSLDPSNGGSKKRAPYDFTRGENFTVLGADKGFAWIERNDAGTESKMYNVNVGADGTLTNYETPIDLGNVDITRFFSAGNGNLLYGVRVQEGSVKKMDPEAEEQMLQIYEEGGDFYQNDSGFCAFDYKEYAEKLHANADRPEDVHQFQVVACRWDNVYQRYREFFPYAYLEKAPDDFSAFPMMQTTGCLGGTSMVYNTITDLDTQSSQLTYAEVTPVSLLTYESVVCMDSFIGEGTWTVHPQVKVTNTGNMPICGFTVKFELEPINPESSQSVLANGRTPLKDVTIEHLEQHVQKPLKPAREKDTIELMELTGWDSVNAAADQPFAYAAPIDQDGWSKDDEAIIWPGSTRIYEIPLTVEVDLKKGWQKKNKIHVDVINPVVPELGKKDAQDRELGGTVFANEGNYQDFGAVFVGDEEAGYVDLTFEDEKIKPSADIQRSDYEIVKEHEWDLPQAGDSPLLAVAGAAAVAAGAAAVAASRGVKRTEEE